MPKPIRILIADDHAVVRKGLAMVLRLEPDFEVVGEAENGRQAVELAQAPGVDGYVLKDVAPDELAHAIRAVAQGEAYLHPAVARRLLNRMSEESHAPPPEVSLTPRELEILKWMATPATYREIAEKLYISESTVRSHAKRILSKLGQPNRAQAVLAAVRAGLIELPE